jgi:hypothetical protein
VPRLLAKPFSRKRLTDTYLAAPHITEFSLPASRADRGRDGETEDAEDNAA